jgi:hypothetical protein
MIIVVEPICKLFSHEKVNSGFLYGLRLAFPDESIRVYADKTHIAALKEILAHDRIAIDDIEYIPIILGNSISLSGAIRYYAVFNSIFKNVVKARAGKIFFLSYSPVILYIIKRLKEKAIFSHLKFSFVLHGDFENIVNDKESVNPLVSPKVPIVIPGKSFGDRLSTIELKTIPVKLISIAQLTLGRLFDRVKNSVSGVLNYSIPVSRWFSTREMLLWKNSPDFRYIALANHVVGNAQKYIDTQELNIFTVVLPTNFAAPVPRPKNKFAKFAIFGFGSPAVLREIAYRLDERKIEKEYEIRIIGMDNAGLSGHAHVTCPSPGKPLSRQDMEKYAEDIDMFLILYHKGQYKLTCSGTILEAISNVKPILHFDNDCVNSFNKHDQPIGICCNTMEEYLERMEDIIANYESYNAQFQVYRSNIMELRTRLSVGSSVPRMRESFTWES